MVNFITIQCNEDSDSSQCSLGELCEYIADYIDEELERGVIMEGGMIRQAIDAYQGGAR